MNILLCQHGGSGNHGCEALARTAEMLLRKAFPQGGITLYSYRLGDDELYLRDSAMTLAGLRDLAGLSRLCRPSDLAGLAGLSRRLCRPFR